jgi:hypothetical protein
MMRSLRQGKRGFTLSKGGFVRSVRAGMACAALMGWPWSFRELARRDASSNS